MQISEHEHEHGLNF